MSVSLWAISQSIEQTSKPLRRTMAELQTTSFDLEDFLKDEEPAKKRPRISPKPSCVVDVSFNDSGFFSPTRDVIAHSDVTAHCDVTNSAPSAGNTSVLSHLSSQARFADLIPSLKEIEHKQPTSLISALRPEHQLADRLASCMAWFFVFWIHKFSDLFSKKIHFRCFLYGFILHVGITNSFNLDETHSTQAREKLVYLNCKC